MSDEKLKNKENKSEDSSASSPIPNPPSPLPEAGGRGGLDPVRYGDWEIGGKCVDF